MKNKQFLPALILCLFASGILFGQQQATLLSNWQGENITPSVWHDNGYNEIWGYAANNKEYAILGSSLGHHIIDVTNPTTPTEIHFLLGQDTGQYIVHRDYHDYAGYLYAVCDEGLSTLQIYDLSNIETAAPLIYNDDSLIARAHNIYIDTAQAMLYACGTYSPHYGGNSIMIISLVDPANPNIVGFHNNSSALPIPNVHDMYVKDGIAYLNCGNQGFYVVDFNSPANPVLLGTMTGYIMAGYNHSGWLSNDEQTYYLADETHNMDIKTVDVSDFTDMKVLGTFNAESTEANTIVHNMLIRDDYLYVSYYYDGLQVFDISNPTVPQRVLYYDTYLDPSGTAYRGAWGVYAYLPSGNILVSDMQTGLYVFGSVLTSLNKHSPSANDITITPTLFTDEISMSFSLENAVDQIGISLIASDGRVIQNNNFKNLSSGAQKITMIPPADLAQGIYFITFTANNAVYSGKVIKE